MEAKDLKEQNSLLHSQIDTFISRSSSSSSSPSPSSSSLSDVSFDTSVSLTEEDAVQKTQTELFTVIKFLRRENEILRCRKELLEQEATRLRYIYIEREREELVRRTREREREREMCVYLCMREREREKEREKERERGEGEGDERGS